MSSLALLLTLVSVRKAAREAEALPLVLSFPVSPIAALKAVCICSIAVGATLSGTLHDVAHAFAVRAQSCADD